MLYRYIQTGFFEPENYDYRLKDSDQSGLMIDIPMPYVHKSKEKAQGDSHFSCRFMFASWLGEVVLVFYPGEGFERIEDIDGRPALKVWVEGEPCYYMTHDEFTRLGGIIWESPAYMVSNFAPGSSEADILSQIERLADQKPEPGAERSIEDSAVDVTFTELFPSLTPEKGLVYIDGEAECIAEVPEGE